MRSLFLLFVCTVMLLFLKNAQDTVKYKIQRIDVNYSELIEFTGKLHLPRTITYDEMPVKQKVRGFIEISVDGKIYTYKQKLVSYGTVYKLKGNETEVWVKKGSRVSVDFENSNLTGTKPVKMFLEVEE